MPLKQGFVGIDVSCKSLHVAVHGHDDVLEFDNTPTGHKKLFGYLKKRARQVTVVLESTGIYGLDIALFLHEQKRARVCYVNPRQAKAFGAVNQTRAKTDRVDALVLAKMAASVELKEWEPPEARALALRALTRRLRTVINDRTREKNRLKTALASTQTPDILVEDIRAHLGELDQRIERLKQGAIDYARGFNDFSEAIDLITSIRGVGEQTAVETLSELACMPRDLTARQAVAQAGLDPRARQSGQRDGRRHISKMGSKYLRATLFVAAVNTVHWCPEIATFFKVLTEERMKPKKVAYVAVARKLLHTIVGILRTGTEFQPERFYRPNPVGIAA